MFISKNTCMIGKKFNGQILHEKKEFYSNFNKEESPSQIMSMEKEF